MAPRPALGSPSVLRARGRAVLVALLAALGPACGGSPGTGASEVLALARPSRRDPALAEVRAVLEQGRGDLALALLERVGGFEAECLRARAEVLGGDGVAALRALDRARELAPQDPELAATEVELQVALGRIAAAGETLVEALKRLGPAPALLRARGVLELSTPNHGAAALEALERARAGDPELPFVQRPLALAHVLVGRALLESSPAEATAHAQAARAAWPPLEDALELEAEGLAGELRFEEALERYAELEEHGRDLGETPAILHQRCATRCLLEHEERGTLLERGIAASEAGDWGAAAEAFGAILAFAPSDLEAGEHLGVARFQRADYRGAATVWAEVLGHARAGTDQATAELLGPLPLNLAKAWRLAGEPDQARRVLSELLDRDPDGPWSEGARELLTVLEAEGLARR